MTNIRVILLDKSNPELPIYEVGIPVIDRVLLDFFEYDRPDIAIAAKLLLGIPEGSKVAYGVYADLVSNPDTGEIIEEYSGLLNGFSYGDLLSSVKKRRTEILASRVLGEFYKAFGFPFVIS